MPVKKDKCAACSCGSHLLRQPASYESGAGEALGEISQQIAE